MPPLLPASTLAAQLEPYKKLLGVLVRQDCISLAISNPYLNLAEPLGGLMLRDGRLSERALQRLLSSQQQDIAGYIVGCEVKADAAEQHWQLPQQQQEQQQQQQWQRSLQQQAPIQQQAVHQVEAALGRLGLRGGWYGSWCPDTAGESCRIMPPAGPAAAAAVSVQQQLLNQWRRQHSGVDLARQSRSIEREADAQQNGVVAAAAAAPNEPAGATGTGGVQERCSLGQQFLQSYLESLGSLNTFG